MNRTEALEALTDGHTVWKSEFAEQVCAVLGVPWSEELVETFNYEGGKGYLGNDGDIGVYGLSLGYHIVKHLDLEYRDFFGRGSQAREYSRVIREKLQA